jgi:hypothetical protein
MAYLGHIRVKQAPPSQLSDSVQAHGKKGSDPPSCVVLAKPLLHAAVLAPECPVVLIFRPRASFDCPNEGATVRAEAGGRVQNGLALAERAG